jgi:hypothetical protein
MFNDCSPGEDLLTQWLRGMKMPRDPAEIAGQGWECRDI